MSLLGASAQAMKANEFLKTVHIDAGQGDLRSTGLPVDHQRSPKGLADRDSEGVRLCKGVQLGCVPSAEL